MWNLIISLILSGGGAILLVFCSLKMLQIYQLSSYKADGFIKWFKRTKGDYALRYFSLAFFQFVCLMIFNFSFPDSYLKCLGLILHLGLGVYFIVLQQKQKQKTPLRFTPRIIRQIVLLFTAYFGLCFLSVYFTLNYAIGCALLSVVTLLIPLCVTLTHFLALPVEALINKYYFTKARRRLFKASENGLIKIGITGSYGKTTAKNILDAMLGEKYKVLSTPASHNTPMGICKLVNSGGLQAEGNGAPCQIFIAEMGARHRGDIKELCDLVMPDYGIITAIGPQHLETFKTVDAVVETKLELALAARSFVVLNSDDKTLTAAAEKLNQNNSKSFLYAGEMGGDASFENVTVSADGTAFTLLSADEKTEIVTPLLGRHIPPLITMCAALSLRLGVSLQQIKQAAQQLKPVPHRLQLIKTGQGAVIDDAYNSNPEGAKNALEVLGYFKDLKVVITPGFVELGAATEEESLKLGENIAKKADFLISVANDYVLKGATAAGMDADRCFVQPTLDAAMQKLASLKLEKVTVLFLNDLPDNY